MNTKRTRVMMIGLDGCELTLAQTMLAQGRLPALSRLTSDAARYLLDHGDAKRTGLAWEHVSTGLSPDEASRWAAVDFFADTYAVRQRPTNLTPFLASLNVRSVVVDPPYFDLNKTPGAKGLVAWGAHDPGVKPSYRPAGLEEEIKARFGDYAASDWIYGFVWPSLEKTREMGDALVRATEQRSALAQWLFQERLPDWELGLVVVSEYHSATEALWHGVDETHPLHGLESASAARAGVEGVYEAGDAMIGALMDAFPDARFVVFNLHGMGANNSDNLSMVLLAELLYRREFGRPLMQERVWPTTKDGIPLFQAHEDWARELGRMFAPKSKLERVARKIARRLQGPPKADGPPLDWMPATQYQPHWRRMRAFALPSFYDGRIRINLKGREREGLVDLSEYDAECEKIVALLQECRDPITDGSIVDSVEKRRGNPLGATESEADLIVAWTMAPHYGLKHPSTGVIGPLPYRRTGGHTGPHGFAYFKGPGITPGDFGTRSAFDVVPTVLEMLDAGWPSMVSGDSVAPALITQT